MHNYNFHVPITQLSARCPTWEIDFLLQVLDSRFSSRPCTGLNLINDFERRVPVLNFSKVDFVIVRWALKLWMKSGIWKKERVLPANTHMLKLDRERAREREWESAHASSKERSKQLFLPAKMSEKLHGAKAKANAKADFSSLTRNVKANSNSKANTKCSSNSKQLSGLRVRALISLAFFVWFVLWLSFAAAKSNDRRWATTHNHCHCQGERTASRSNYQQQQQQHQQQQH